MFQNFLKFLIPTVFTTWFTPSIGAAVSAVGSALGGITLGNVASAIGIANGVSNLLGGGGSAPSGAANVGGSGSSGSGTSVTTPQIANLTPGLTSGYSAPITLGGHFTGNIPTYNTQESVSAAEGGLIGPSGLNSFMGINHMAEGGNVNDHQPEFYSEGGLKHTYVQGDGDGTSDSVPAMLANGEFVIPADVVSSLGNGSSDGGSKVLDEFLQVVRQHKANHDSHKLPPDSKGTLAYLSIASKKAKI